MKKNIFITGFTGFLGGFLTDCLSEECYNVTGSTRKVLLDKKRLLKSPVTVVDSACYSSENSGYVFENIDTVIHLAAKVPSLKVSTSNLEAFRSVNVLETLQLARRAEVSGVRRFIFMSSIKVNGESTSLGEEFRSSDICNPIDAYGQSKYEAETLLLELASHSAMEVVIIRPPLIYGAGVKGNFKKLIDLVSMGIPLPFSGISNRRSYVSVENLVDLIVTCIDHPAAKNRIFLVSDDQDLSTSDLLKFLALSTNNRSLLFPFPKVLISSFLSLIGKQGMSSRLFGSLVVNIADTKDTLSWLPIVSVEQGIKNMCDQKNITETKVDTSCI